MTNKDQTWMRFRIVSEQIVDDESLEEIQSIINTLRGYGWARIEDVQQVKDQTDFSEESKGGV